MVPVRIEGLDKVLHHILEDGQPGTGQGGASARRCGLTGDDYEALAKQVEEAVRSL